MDGDKNTKLPRETVEKLQKAEKEHGGLGNLSRKICLTTSCLRSIMAGGNAGIKTIRGINKFFEDGTPVNNPRFLSEKGIKILDNAITLDGVEVIAKKCDVTKETLHKILHTEYAKVSTLYRVAEFVCQVEQHPEYNILSEKERVALIELISKKDAHSISSESGCPSDYVGRILAGIPVYAGDWVRRMRLYLDNPEIFIPAKDIKPESKRPRSMPPRKLIKPVKKLSKHINLSKEARDRLVEIHKAFGYRLIYKETGVPWHIQDLAINGNHIHPEFSMRLAILVTKYQSDPIFPVMEAVPDRNMKLSYYTKVLYDVMMMTPPGPWKFTTNIHDLHRDILSMKTNKKVDGAMPGSARTLLTVLKTMIKRNNTGRFCLEVAHRPDNTVAIYLERK